MKTILLHFDGKPYIIKEYQYIVSCKYIERDIIKLLFIDLIMMNFYEHFFLLKEEFATVGQHYHTRFSYTTICWKHTFDSREVSKMMEQPRLHSTALASK